MKSKITGWQICVVDNGFVFVGDCDATNRNTLVIQRCKQLRKWGTQRGLGQLIDGPTKETIIDPVEVIMVPYARIVFTIPVNQMAWEKF